MFEHDLASVYKTDFNHAMNFVSIVRRANDHNECLLKERNLIKFKEC